MSIDLGSGLELSGVCYGAAGICDRTYSQLIALDRSDAAAIVSKSATMESVARDGIRVKLDSPTVYNCVGLTNEGLEYYCRWKASGRCPYIISIYPADIYALREQLCMLEKYAVRHCELNISCGNVWRGLPVGADPALLLEYLEICAEFRKRRSHGNLLSVGLKMPMALWPRHLEDTANALSIGAAGFDYLVCCNSLPGLFVDGLAEERSSASGGAVVRGLALAHVQFYSACGFRTVGCGGIETRAHIREFLKAGALACQVGSALLIRGPEIFGELNDTRAKL